MRKDVSKETLNKKRDRNLIALSKKELWWEKLEPDLILNLGGLLKLKDQSFYF